MVGRQRGFTLVEFLIGAGVTLVALGLAVTLLLPASRAWQMLPETADVQQRARVAIDALRSDLAAAGSGFSLGWGAAAAVTWPAVMPCRWTGVPLSAVAGGCAKADSITVVSMAAAAPQALTDAEVSDLSAPISVVSASACALDRAACRLHAGSLLLMADGTSAFDLFTASAVSPDGRMVTHAQSRLSGPYAAGALVGEVDVRSYDLAAEPGTGTWQLRRADSGGVSFPVVDGLAALSFQYFGEAAPPVVLRQDDPLRRAVTYGPLPPPLGVDNTLDAWPAGENCAFAVDGNRQVARLAALPTDPSGLAPLPLALFADGPWCPDSASPNRYDADLLRIRLVRVTLRVPAQRQVPDFEVTFDAAPRSMRR